MQLLKRISGTIGWAAFIIWGILTPIVIFFLIDRWNNPGIKGISNSDLSDYVNFSIWLLGFFAASRLIIWFTALDRRSTAGNMGFKK